MNNCTELLPSYLWYFKIFTGTYEMRTQGLFKPIKYISIVTHTHMYIYIDTHTVVFVYRESFWVLSIGLWSGTRGVSFRRMCVFQPPLKQFGPCNKCKFDGLGIKSRAWVAAALFRPAICGRYIFKLGFVALWQFASEMSTPYCAHNRIRGYIINI